MCKQETRETIIRKICQHLDIDEHDLQDVGKMLGYEDSEDFGIDILEGKVPEFQIEADDILNFEP